MIALAAVVALGANVGLFGLTGNNDGPGQFKLVDNARQVSPSVHTEVVDVPGPAASTPTGASSSKSAAPGSGTPASSSKSAVPGSGTSAASSQSTTSSGAGRASVPPGPEPSDDGHPSEPGHGADD